MTPGLSVTLGLRLDYEKQYLRYNTSMALDLRAENKPAGPPMLPPARIEMPIARTLVGTDDQQFCSTSRKSRSSTSVHRR